MSSNKKEKITFGPVYLESTNRELSLHFWEKVIGLKLRKEEGHVLEFGTEKEVLVNVALVAKKSFQEGFSGLYHLAIHIATEKEFAEVLWRLISMRYPMGPTDHIFSKAIYLTDPDNITVELTLETPERFEKYDTESGEFNIIDSQGNVRHGTEPLDVREVLSKLGDADPEINTPLSNDTKIGHMHLYVNDLEENYRFYQKLGFEQNLLFEALQFADLSAGGIFPHRMAMNTWRSKGKPQAPAGTARMRYFELRYANTKELQEAIAKSAATERGGGYYEAKDPSGNLILLRLASNNL